MADKADYFLQILDTIGTPLMAPVLAHGNGKDEDAAREIAALLARTVQASIDFGPLVDIDTLGARTDSVRVALAGLAAQVTGSVYDRLGRMPADSDLKKMYDGFQAAISFSDNFTAGPESILRLDTVSPNGSDVDTPQSVIQYLACFVPILKAVSGFAFGQPEAKLISDIAAHLTEKARDIAESHFAGAHEGDSLKAIERGILHCLARIYAAAHEAEVVRMNNADRDSAAQGGIDEVWAAFDTQAHMLEILALTIVPGGALPDEDRQTVRDSGESQAPAKSSPIAATKPAEPPKTQAPPLSAATTGSGPMSFFKPKTDGEAESAPPPAPDAPLTAPQAEDPVEPPSAAPAVAAPQEKPREEEKKTPPTGQSGNPMSFFKPKSDDGEEG